MPLLRYSLRGFLAIFLFVTPAAADCATATVPLDRLVCSTPELATMDRDLNTKYQAAIAVLSATGQKHVRAAERQWLALVRAACGPLVGQPDVAGEGPVSCLRVQYSERLDQLDLAAKRVGPYLISNVEDLAFSVDADDDKGGYDGPVSFRRFSIPVIDQPLTPATERWNAAVRKLASDLEADFVGMWVVDPKPGSVNPGYDTILSYELGLGGADFLSLNVEAFVYEHGEPHGHVVALQSNQLLWENRELAFKELFRNGTDWPKVLEAACRKAVSNDDPVDAADCEGDTFSWFARPEGLVLRLPMQGPPAQIADEYGITIPWSALAPVLSASLPFSPRSQP